MEKIFINKEIIDDILKRVEIVNEEKTEEYKKAVKEANERIKENRRKEAEAWCHASTYISD